MKKALVTSCSQSHGRPIVRVTTSQKTVVTKQASAIPQAAISTRSTMSSAGNLRCRSRSATSQSAEFIGAFRRGALFHRAHEGEHFHRMRPELLGELVVDRRGRRDEAAFVDILREFDADLLQPGDRLALERDRLRRLVLADFVGGGLHVALL